MVTSGPQQPGEGSRLSKLVAKNGAVVTIGTDRRVVGDEAEFDAKADTALFTGNVVVNQLKNVLQGRRLFVDRKTGKSRLESPAEARPASRAASPRPSTRTTNKARRAAQAQVRSRRGRRGRQGSVFGTFKTDPNAPIDVEADTLDVHDQVKQAIFRGNVKSQQGDFVVRTVEMAVFYTGQAGFAMASGGAEDPANKTPSQLTQGGGAAEGADHLQGRADRHRRLGDLRRQGQHRSDGRPRGGLARQGRGRGAAAQDRPHHRHVPLRAGVGDGRGAVPGHQRCTRPHGDPAAAPGARSPTGRACPPGKQCLLFYPKEAQEKAKEAIKKVLPDARRQQGRQWVGAEHQREPGAAEQLTPMRLFPFLAKKVDAGGPPADARAGPATARPGGLEAFDPVHGGKGWLTVANVRRATAAAWSSRA